MLCAFEKGEQNGSNKNLPITLYERVKNLINDGKPQAAFELIIKSKQESAEMQNARAVCLIRSGNFKDAISVLASIVFPGRMVGVPSGTPVIYITNLAIAMLKIGNIAGAISLFKQIEPKDINHPAVLKLKSTIESWKQSLPFFGKLQLAMGIVPSKPVTVENADGDLQ